MNHFQSSTERSNCSMQSCPQLWAFVTLHSNKAVNAPFVVSLWGLSQSVHLLGSEDKGKCFVFGDIPVP